MRMRERIRQKIHTEKGFTLAETLLAALIMLLVSGIVASGIPVAKDAYEKVVLASNAEVLLSTTISTLRNELGTAQDVVADVDSEGKKTIVTYYSGLRGASSKIYLGSKNSVGSKNSDDRKEIMFLRYYNADGLSYNAYKAAPLIPAKTSTEELYVTYDTVDYSNGIVTFKGLLVKRALTNDGFGDERTLSIRVISYDGKEEEEEAEQPEEGGL